MARLVSNFPDGVWEATCHNVEAKRRGRRHRVAQRGQSKVQRERSAEEADTLFQYLVQGASAQQIGFGPTQWSSWRAVDLSRRVRTR